MPDSVNDKLVTYAQNGEDIMLHRALKHVERGFYIDVGAQDPVIDSVTRMFYERGWRGINLEPVPRWHARLQQDRPHDINLQVAAAAHTGKLKLFEIDDSGLSTSNPDYAHRHESHGFEVHEGEVACTTLDDVCREYKVETVHFLKIDCEGAEQAALEGMSFKAVRPWIVLVEATEPLSTRPAWHAWEPLLVAHDYAYVYSDGLNRFYIAAEHPELRAAFRVPANVLDGARRAAEVRYEGEVVRLTAEVDRMLAAESTGRAAVLDEVKAAHQESRAEILRARDAELRTRDAELRARDADILARDTVIMATSTERDALRDEVARRKLEFAAVAAERNGLREEAGVWRAQVVGATAEQARLNDLATALQTQLDRHVALLEATTVDRDSLRHELQRYVDLLQATTSDRDRERSERGTLEAQLALLQRSWSWRLSAPVRFAGRAARRIRRALRPAAR